VWSSWTLLFAQCWDGPPKGQWTWNICKPVWSDFDDCDPKRKHASVIVLVPMWTGVGILTSVKEGRSQQGTIYE
jgi:hypothetical protein